MINLRKPLEYKMKLIIAALLFLSVSIAHSMDPQALEMLKSMKVDKAQISVAIDQLQSMGRITPEQAAKAKKELNGMNDADVDKYNKMAHDKIKNGDVERLMAHDFKKGTPTLEPSSVVEVPKSKRSPASAPEATQAPQVDNTKVDFSKLGQ